MIKQLLWNRWSHKEKLSWNRPIHKQRTLGKVFAQIYPKLLKIWENLGRNLNAPPCHFYLNFIHINLRWNLNKRTWTTHTHTHTTLSLWVSLLWLDFNDFRNALAPVWMQASRVYVWIGDWFNSCAVDFLREAEMENPGRKKTIYFG